MLELATALTVWEIHTLNLHGRCACAWLVLVLVLVLVLGRLHHRMNSLVMVGSRLPMKMIQRGAKRSGTFWLVAWAG